MSHWLTVLDRCGFDRGAAVGVERDGVLVDRPPGIEGNIRSDRLGKVVLRAARLGSVPSVECVPGAGRCSGLGDLLPVVHCRGFDHSATVGVECDDVLVDRPPGVHRHVCGDRFGEVVLRAAVLGCVPAIERIAGARGVGGL